MGRVVLWVVGLLLAIYALLSMNAGHPFTLADSSRLIPGHSITASAKPQRTNYNGQFAFIKGLFAYGIIGFLLLYPLIHGVINYRDYGDVTAFFPVLMVLVLFGGIWAWFGYFGDHGGLLLWPLVVAFVVAALGIVRAVIVDRQNRERADELKQFPAPPKTGGPSSPNDFEDW